MMIPLHCSSPIAGAASKRIFQLFLSIITGYLAYQSRDDIEEAVQWGNDMFQILRIRPVLLRDGSTPGLESEPAFSGFGLLMNRCPVLPSSQSWQNGTLQVLH
jgi:hypothetical protein